MSKEKASTEREHHQGSVVSEDIVFTEWLNRLWARSEPPERIELWQVFGKFKTNRADMIHHEDFKAGEKLDVEQVNKLANEILAAAQNDADGLGKESTYQLSVIDRNRTASPLVRRIGPIAPKRKNGLSKSGGANFDGDEEDDDGTDPKNLAYRYVQDGMSQVRWDKTRNDQLVGGLLTLSYHRIEKLESSVDRLMDRVMIFFDKVQESQDRALDRELIRDREKFKNDLMKEGMITARNILPGLFARNNGEQNQQQTADLTTAPAANGEPAAFGMSPERILVGNFLRDCENAKIDLALFGNYEEVDGKAVQTTPGIFSPRQFSVLYGVSEGRLPAAALDNLMPGSKHKDEVTQDLIVKAQEAGVTEGIGMALLEIIGLRRRAKELANGTQEEESSL